MVTDAGKTMVTNCQSYSKETPDIIHIFLNVTEQIQKMFSKLSRLKPIQKILFLP